MTRVKTQFFKNAKVKGDKITFHKCELDAALKYIHGNAAYDVWEERTEGRDDIVRDMLIGISSGMKEERRRLEKKNKL